MTGENHEFDARERALNLGRCLQARDSWQNQVQDDDVWSQTRRHGNSLFAGFGFRANLPTAMPGKDRFPPISNDRVIVGD
jgi:hypothetical protein